MTRVQIPAYHDFWMRGARFGEVVKVTNKRQTNAHGTPTPVKIAHVKLDANGKTIRVRLDDCTEV